MILTKDRQKSTGAFYTPSIWADKAVEAIRQTLTYPEDYLFYDPAAGEGALLEALPDWVDKCGTTLESEDVLICQKKSLRVLKLNFLEDNINELFSEQQRKKLVVFMNPPYVKLAAGSNLSAYKKYRTNDATALFYYRVFLELKPFAVFSFNKLDLMQGSTMKTFRDQTGIWESHISTFLTNSKTWGLNGSFPIAFHAFLPGAEINCDQYITAKVFHNNETFTKKIWRYN